MSDPLIVHWPRGIGARGEIRHVPAHVIDLVPTILEATGHCPNLSAPDEVTFMPAAHPADLSVAPAPSVSGTGTAVATAPSAR